MSQIKELTDFEKLLERSTSFTIHENDNQQSALEMF